MTSTTPGDEAFLEETLDAQLDVLAQTLDQPPVTPTSRAYRALTHLHAPIAAQEAEAIERVRQRLAPHMTAPAAQAPHIEEEPDLLIASEPPHTLPDYQARRVRPRSRMRALVNSAAALLVVSLLLGGFFALLHPGGSTPASNAYQWQIVPSANTPLAVNALTGITVRASTDAWAWGEANVAPTNGSGTDSNPIQTPLVEHWDGSKWSIVATPAVPYGGQIADIVALAPDNAWAVGGLLITPTSSENTTGATLIEHWDGHTWTIQPDQVVNADLSALAALAADDIWAVGRKNVGHNAIFEHWDGTQWNIMSSPSAGGIGPLASNRALFAISAVSSTDVWAAGAENPAIPIPNGTEPLFEHWDGHTWSVVASPSLTGKISAIVALGPDDVWAVGIQGFGIDTGQQGQGLIEHWDGRQWSVIANPSPQPFTQLSGVAHDPTVGKLWVVGATGPTHDGDQLYSTQTLIETTQ